MSETQVQESDKVKMFDKFISDLQDFINNEGSKEK